VNAAFTEATGIEVNYMTYDSNESLYTKLKTGGSSYDVIIPSDYMIARLIAEDMLEPLDFSNIPNYEYVDEAYKNTAYDPDNTYSVPYTWGSVGIIYNTKYIDEVTGWDALWNEDYSGKILMFDNPRDAFAVAEFLNGDDVNSEDETVLNSAAALLTEQKPLVQSYVMDQVYSKLEHEEAWIAPYYAGDYLQMVTENENLAFCFPRKASTSSSTPCASPRAARIKKPPRPTSTSSATRRFRGRTWNISAIQPRSPPPRPIWIPRSRGATSLIRTPTPLPAVRLSLLSTETNQLMDSLWLQVKTSAENSGKSIVPTVIIIIFIAAAAAFFLLRASNAKKRKAKRCKSCRQNV
jgi:spermidine/putrescine transport system substrate-binding protein